MIDSVSIVGGLLVLAGYGLRYWMARRQFNRRNPFGVSEYRSFEHYTVYGFFEKRVRQIGWLMLAAGWVLIFVTAVNYYSARKHRQQQQPTLQQPHKGN